MHAHPLTFDRRIGVVEALFETLHFVQIVWRTDERECVNRCAHTPAHPPPPPSPALRHARTISSDRRRRCQKNVSALAHIIIIIIIIIITNTPPFLRAGAPGFKISNFKHHTRHHRRAHLLCKPRLLLRGSPTRTRTQRHARTIVRLVTHQRTPTPPATAVPARSQLAAVARRVRQIAEIASSPICHAPSTSATKCLSSRNVH
jgi:hypothetical protein